MAKKRKAPAKKGVTHKPARKRRADNPDTAVNTLVVLVVIVLVLGSLFFYAQNKRQIALFPGLFQSVVALITPAQTESPPTIQPEAQPTALIKPPSEPLPPIATPTPPITASPEITGSVQTSQTTASAKARRAPARAVQPAPATEARPFTPIPVVPSENH